MKYRKKPVIVEAIQWTGENLPEVLEFAGEYTVEAYGKVLYVETLEGNMLAGLGDYIIKGVNGEIYPCRSNIFEKTYEEVI